MCGIAGICHLAEPEAPVSASVLDAMTDAVAHRGPDGRGTLRLPGIGLGHRRLSIIDPSDAGRQPMSADSERVWVTYNGEIYNYRELRGELEKKGHHFRSHSDTEVLLEAYLEWGLDCLDAITGIFAFALWDAREKRLWLVRDHLGVKPLFYAISGGTLRFASEVQALWQDPSLAREVDPEGLDAFMTFSYAPAPLTGYKNVRQLLPGQWLTAKDGVVSMYKYWSPPVDATKFRESDDELQEAFDELWNHVVDRQRVADVPVGSFLSGGIDSFAVTRALQNVNGTKARAFSMGFKEPSFDEAPLASLAAERLGVEFQCGYVEDVEQAELREIFAHAQEPFADSSMLAVYKLSEMTRKSVKVVLSGDGGDEVLAGYPTYRASRYADYYRAVPRVLREGVFPSLAAMVPRTGKKYSFHQVLNRFVYGANQGKWKDHASWRIICTDAIKREIYSEEFWRLSRELDPLKAYWGPMAELAASHELSDLDVWLYADLTFYLPNDMLVKVDRMSMAHGLEARVPFLDRELVEFCWRLPDHLKRRGAQGKVLLRRNESAHYPDTLAKIPKKGFNVPIERWFREGRLRLAPPNESNLFSTFFDSGAIEAVQQSHRAGSRDAAHVLYALSALEHM